MQSNSSNGWVMVTGGTGGIGKALIARLAAERPERRCDRARTGTHIDAPGLDASQAFGWT